MNRDAKRILSAIGAGVAMSFVIWLFGAGLSPARSYLLDHPAGYAVMLLNLPALFVSRIFSGSPPSEIVVYVACFIQWFAIGLVVSAAIWRAPAAAQPGFPANGVDPAGEPRR